MEKNFTPLSAASVKAGAVSPWHKCAAPRRHQLGEEGHGRPFALRVWGNGRRSELETLEARQTLETLETLETLQTLQTLETLETLQTLETPETPETPEKLSGVVPTFMAAFLCVLAWKRKGVSFPYLISFSIYTYGYT